MASFKNTCRRIVVGSVIGSLAAIGSMAGIAHADNPAPPGPVPSPPDLQHPPHSPIPLPGGGG
jgi:hypothetical protein